MNRGLCSRNWTLVKAGFCRCPLAYFSSKSKYVFFPCAIHKSLTSRSEPSPLLHLIFSFSSCNLQVDTTKAVITLQPPWVSVFQEETVTLQCEVPRLPGSSSTQWFLNGTATQTSTPSYRITSASVKDSGEYRCQRGPSGRSDPIQLEIHRGNYDLDQEGWKPQGLPLRSLLSGHQMCVCQFI